MNPMLQIYHNWAPDYGPSSELSLDDQIRQLKYMQDNKHPAFSKWPFSTDPRQVQASQEFAAKTYDDAFENPIPKHMGNPEYVGPYMVGSTLPDPSWKEPGGDQYYTDMLNYSAKKGLLSQDMAEDRASNLLDDPSMDYFSLINAGELSLEDAIRLMGRVPNQLQGLLK